MPQKRKSGYALDDDDDNINGFGGLSNRTDTVSSATKSSKRSKKTTSATPPIDNPAVTIAHFADAPTSQVPKSDDDGNLYWEISKARRVTLSDFKGKKMVGIREYYEKDGQMLPGKKGISMTLEQYGVLVTLLPGIEGELKKTGILDVPRPDYDGAQDADVDVDRDSDGIERGGGRANHEATSDEED